MPNTKNATPGVDGPNTAEPLMDITTSRQFTSFLAQTSASLAISTYQAGMVLIIGTDPETGKLWVFNRHVERPMGIASDRSRLAVAGLTQIITFVDGHFGTPTDTLCFPVLPRSARPIAFKRCGNLGLSAALLLRTVAI